MATHLTERIVKAAEIGTRKYVVFDEDCAGFGLCVFESGRKTFILIYRAAGRQRRMTIGTWPSWSVIAAREEAKRLKRDIDRGEDPMDVRSSARHAPTVDELVDRYIDEHLPKLSGLVAVWCRSFGSVMCSKGDEAWAQSGRMNFARMRCGSR